MKRNYTILNCYSCGVICKKRNDTLKLWSGLCKKCSMRDVSNRPEIKIKKSINAKSQVLKQGGIPNAKKFNINTKKENHPRWKGGLPKCIDCGVELSLYSCKRCVPCTAKNRSGDKHWNWKGGITNENIRVRQSKEYSNWRSNVFKRDNWTCVKCGYKSVVSNDIRADHIKPFHLFESERLSVDNGRTLCVKCDGVHGYNYFRDRHKFEASRSVN